LVVAMRAFKKMTPASLAPVRLPRLDGTTLPGKNDMSVDGNWKITINTPMGARMFEMSVQSNGDSFIGSASSDMGSQDFTGKVNGNNLTWSFDVTNPMPMKLEFDANVDGDKMTGNVKIGMFGNAVLAGERA
jgi:hypothetical protein